MSAPTFATGSVPSGQSAPFIVASPTDHSADIVIVATTGVALILITCVIRIYIRFNFSGPWLADDSVFALATVREFAAEHRNGTRHNRELGCCPDSVVARLCFRPLWMGKGHR
jgi:hypothetical protein